METVIVKAHKCIFKDVSFYYIWKNEEVDMLKKRNVQLLLISIIPIILIVVSIVDVMSVLGGKLDYPFGSEFFSNYSIYVNKSIYLTYQILNILLLLTLIVAGIKGSRRTYIIVLGMNFTCFFYPIFII